MKDTLILEGKTYISAKRAAKVMKYAQDYIGQLCRSNKLDCKMVGRSWFVTEESLINHRQSTLDGKDSILPKSVKSIPVPVQSSIALNQSSNNSIFVSSTISPISLNNSNSINNESKNIQTLKYESQEGPRLPEIKKRVPQEFNINNIFDKTVSEFSNKSNNRNSSNINNIKLSSNNSLIKSFPLNTLIVTTIVIMIAFSGYIISSVYLSNKNINSNNQASIGSIIKNIGEGISYGFSSLTRGISNLFVSNNNNNTKTNNINIPTSNNEDASSNINEIKTNGIAISPSANSVNADENTKNRMKNYFSDEVKVNPDKSGTAGVITPVFKKTNGEDFLYVLVPVKEKKQ